MTVRGRSPLFMGTVAVLKRVDQDTPVQVISAGRLGEEGSLVLL